MTLALRVWGDRCKQTSGLVGREDCESEFTRQEAYLEAVAAPEAKQG